MSVRGRIVCLLSVALLSASVGRAGESGLEQRVFAVSDLVVPAENAVRNDKPTSSATRATGWAVTREGKPHVRVTKGAPATTCEDQLIKLITETIAPRSWAEQGGRGTIDYHPLTMALIINQTPDVQDQIADILAALRRLHDMQVSVEVKFVSITDEVLQDLQHNDMLGKPDKKKHAHGNVTYLDDAGVRRFMEAIQEDIHSNVMQAPKVTMFNGQDVGFDAGDYQKFVTGLEIVHRGDRIEYRPKTETVPLGMRMGLHSIVSADRRSVRVDLDAKLSNLASEDVRKFPITTPDPDNPIDPDEKPRTVTHYIEKPRITKIGVKRTLNIPDGHTAVLMGGGSKTMAATTSKVPVLGDVPLVGRLFCSVAYQEVTQHLLVLVTPRILVETEKEEKKSTKPAPFKLTIDP
ncbi:MAG TPA: hypothetical protein VH643_20275 [Gemmataceae bacterium]|jgi:general secretion pathway protein D